MISYRFVPISRQKGVLFFRHPVVLASRFRGNGQVSPGKLKETEISISAMENYEKCVRFPRIFSAKTMVKFHHFLQCSEKQYPFQPFYSILSNIFI